MQISAATIAPCRCCGVAIPQGETYCADCLDDLYDLDDEEAAE